MGWSFKVHGGVAAGLGAVLLVLAGLTWLPGVLPLAKAGWLLALIAVLFLPIVISAVARLFLARVDKSLAWQAFRCLPGWVRMGLAVLILSGVVMTFFGKGQEGNLQAAEVKDGRYFAFDTTPHARGTVELSHEQYQVVLEADQRFKLTTSGALFVGAAYAVLVAGELRRADRGAASPR
ncbi:hypothetical protein JL475_30875 [Streptomyces sp. M2CJ-2]|uniref:hypothetical protein n=1 Tax=Streptomyces sp. M2CJ-2 TaxID=2803948 RepID=UPI0019258400|nr:hypothetical protein [Streptomyces sp. M2CJ-2]MBL3670303.1 hypothetical protein [Streptomyces sp. M2CJ-2]